MEEETRFVENATEAKGYKKFRLTMMCLAIFFIINGIVGFLTTLITKETSVSTTLLLWATIVMYNSFLLGFSKV